MAGIANYVLGVVGAVAVWPGMQGSPWILEPLFLTVVLLNVTAGADNVSLMFQNAGARRA